MFAPGIPLPVSAFLITPVTLPLAYTEVALKGKFIVDVMPLVTLICWVRFAYPVAEAVSCALPVDTGVSVYAPELSAVVL